MMDLIKLIKYNKVRYKSKTIYNILYREFDLTLTLFLPKYEDKLITNYVFCITIYMKNINQYEEDILYLILSFVKITDFYENRLLNIGK
jgi:hypothetical protein